MIKHTFRARLEGGDIPATMTFIRVPKKVMDFFAPRRRVPIKGTLNGTAFRTTIADMGEGPCIGVNAKVRAASGTEFGDIVDVVLEEDTEKRTVSVPKDLLSAMNAWERGRFARFSYTHQKEFVAAIECAKRPETRQRRIQRTLEMIRAKM